MVRLPRAELRQLVVPLLLVVVLLPLQALRLLQVLRPRLA